MAIRSPRILCVDDEPEVLGILSQYLLEEGFAVRTASSARDAIVEAKRWVPKVLIADLLMPRLGGLETVDRVRRINPGVLVVLISGLPDALQAASAAGLGLAGAFPKPLDLPRIVEALVGAGVVPSRLPAEAFRQHAGGKRVLVVDDEPDVRDVLAEYARRKGFHVIEASRGEEAIQHVRASCPDVVLLDLSMPGLGGLETLRLIRSTSSDTPVVMITANSDVQMAKHSLALGAVDYVPKPIDFGYLDAVLAAYVPGRVEA